MATAAARDEMMDELRPDLCVIGAGAAGLAVAAGAVQMGASVVLIERGKMGGDCLNYGCVPSKALLAAGHAASAIRDAGRFGIAAGAPTIDYARVHDHVRGVIAEIAPNDSAERFERLGVTVLRAEARFTGPRTVEAAGRSIRARRFVVATGSSPAVPPIPGLDSVPYHTNGTIFETNDLPRHLVIVGGGPIGAELAQAFRRLGARVTVIEMLRLLGNDDPELAGIVRESLARDGVGLREGARVLRVERVAVIEEHGAERRIEGSDLLIAAGRRANLAGLGLEEAGIAASPKGIKVDSRLRTTNRRVFAVGDAAGAYQFTHVALAHAEIVIRNALFRLPAHVDYRAVPWVTYTEPELAQVGLTEAQARQRHGAVRVLRWPFADNDRARAERTAEGLVKIVASRRGRVLGAGICSPHAGEVIQSWVLAVARGMSIRAMAGVVLPYPTLGEAGKRAAGEFYTAALFGARTRFLVRLLSRLG
jgi:pyruvate/2-oxoglutarate dehydrogenase complex dihydrolipoamide dehydrogenase (E3) component